MKWEVEKRHSSGIAIALVISWICGFYFPRNSSSGENGQLHLIVLSALLFLIVIWAVRPNDQDIAVAKNVSDDEHEYKMSPKDSFDEDPIINNAIKDDNDASSSLPPILAPEQIKELYNRALPHTTRLMKWKRIYSLAQNGDSFHYMMNACASYQHTLIVIRTTRGHLLGGYTETSWSAARNIFFGGRRAFVFCTKPDMCSEELSKYQNEFWRRNRRNSLYIFQWSGKNDYIQICDVKKGALGMGGGDGEGLSSNCSFGWYVQDNFTVGSTGYCDTFCNPSLHKAGSKEEEDGSFDILDMDIYGFESMSLSFSKL